MRFIILTALLLAGSLLIGCSDADKEMREMAYTVGWTCRAHNISLQECKEDYYRIKNGQHIKSAERNP
jgi:hypothetical protein